MLSVLLFSLRLEELRLSLIEDGLDDIIFLVVNSKDLLSRWQVANLRKRVSFPVYEDGYYINIWKSLHGRKDDILVYDR